MDFSKLPTNFFSSIFQYTKNEHNDQYPAIDPTRKELNLAGKVVIITGASRGLGARAFAPAFAKAGVRGIALLATNAEGLANTQELVKGINSEVETLTVTTDVSDPASVASAFSKIKDAFGHADILINNAGVNCDGEGVRLGDADPVLYWRNFEINAKGTFLMTHAFINQLPAADTPATVINLTTGAVWKGSPMMPGYSVSKLVAQQQITTIAAVYPNITAVALHPGLQFTDMLPEWMKRFDRDTPELAGGTAVWLSHPYARFLSGRAISCNWSVEDLLAREGEIKASNDLTMDFVGTFGPQQFVKAPQF